MKRFRVALLAGLATLALGAISVPVASASNGTTVPPKSNSLPALKTVRVHGVAKNGKQFNGTYAIQRFVAGKRHKVFAVGTLKGTLEGRHVTRYNVKLPATRAGSPSNGAHAAQVCTVLRLQLGPIDLNLLGLRVQLFGGTNANNPRPVTLLITANPSGGLLGQLLCSLTSSVRVSGVAKNGKQFSGTYAIQRFVAGKHKVFAVGTLKGTLKGRHVTRYSVKVPVTLAGSPANRAQAAQVCTVLHLQLGPIDLNLLGLRVQLFGGTNANNPQPVTLLITANPSGGLLGQLLCNLTSSLGGSGSLSQLSSTLQQLAATLTSLTSLLGAS